MLEGLEVSEKKFSELREYILGSDFNSVRKQLALEKINSQFRVTDFFDLHSDIVKNKSHVMSYDLTHTLGNFLHDIEISENIEGTRKLARHGDFIISRLRSYLKEFAVVQNKTESQVFSTEYLVYRPKTDKISSNTLLTFCLTDEVQTILNCSQYGTEHPRFYEFVFNELPLPKALFTLNNKINILFDEAFNKREQSHALYLQAEELLLENIGLKNFKPSEKGTNIKSFKESFLGTGRLDAEYYQPKYEEIIDIVRSFKNGFANLELFIDSYSTGYPYNSEIYMNENGISLVRINNLTKEGVNLSNAIQIPKEYLNLSKKDIAQENDILISMSGTIGLSCVVREKNKIVINQRIMKITSKNYNPHVLSMLLNSIIGKYQLERIGTGGVQTNISSNDIKQIFIPIIDNPTQQQIAELVDESFRLRKESERLLEEAKEMVEREIEKVITN